jgi:hypothetical protein
MALQKHALTVYRALNIALAEDVDLTIADLVKSVDGSCMKKAIVGDASWPDAPQGTVQCSIQADPSGKVDEFSITIVGDESTGNFRSVIP